jgi:hypothetical protein
MKRVLLLPLLLLLLCVHPLRCAVGMQACYHSEDRLMQWQCRNVPLLLRLPQKQQW